MKKMFAMFLLAFAVQVTVACNVTSMHVIDQLAYDVDIGPPTKVVKCEAMDQVAAPVTLQVISADEFVTAADPQNAPTVRPQSINPLNGETLHQPVYLHRDPGRWRSLRASTGYADLSGWRKTPSKLYLQHCRINQCMRQAASAAKFLA